MRNFLVSIIICIFTSSANADIFQYVQKQDESFKWEMKRHIEISSGVSGFEIEIVSQRWMDRTWNHRLKIIKPSSLKNKSTALLYITGSGKGDKDLTYSAITAKSAGILTAILHDIPNQPLFGELKEDGLISHTFEQYLNNKNEEWPLLFPMVKSVVRAMDTVQDFSAREFGMKIDSFILMGASKRGWTTWLTPVIDSRVKGIIPMVYDNLNINAQMKHQMDTWGTYSEKLKDYTEKGLQDKIGTGIGKRLVDMVDPYTWRERLVLPKLIINGTNDRYWTLDALNLYWDSLNGEKYVLYLPNSDHKLKDKKRLSNNIVAFCLMVNNKLRFPKLDWKFEEVDGKMCLDLSSNIKPKAVRVWVAVSDNRDFREAKWESSNVRRAKQGYSIKWDIPEKGYLAVFGEAVYRVKQKEFYLSTNVHITGGNKD